MKLNRRGFLKIMYSSTVATALYPLIGSQKLYASSSQDFSDYKALVYVYLHGGNDSFNMIVPTDSTGYDNYKKVRSSLAIKNNDLSSYLKIDETTGKLNLRSGNPYAKENISVLSGNNNDAYLKGLYHISGTDIGINGVMPEVAYLIKSNKMAVLSNIGTLVEPVTKTEIENGNVKLPSYLFSHNTQSRVQETGQADNKSIEGWIGRLFDEWSNINGSDLFGKNISFAGYSHALVGKNVEPLAMSTNPTGFDSRTKTDMREELYDTTDINPFLSLYNKRISNSFEFSSDIATIWDNSHTYSSLDPYGNELFTIPSKDDLQMYNHPSGSLVKQLESVSKMIDYGKNNGVKRQVFFVKLGGFDTHSGQLDNHPKQLRELSMSLGKFQTAMEELGVSDNVTTFTLSDFGRTATSNGNGTDHAWAGHNLVMGGAVKGGIYGEMPDLTPGGDQDYGKNGRIIPSISVDQQLSTLTKWFGVDDSLIEKLFPNISNFDNTKYARDIGFMESTDKA